MRDFLEIWDLIVRSNTFNFVLLLAIFYFILRKINISQTVEKLQKDIINTIENVKNNKRLADEKLAEAKASVQNLDKDIEFQMEQAEANAKAIAETIFDNTQKRINTIKGNVDKSISTEEKSLSAKLTEKAATAAVALAKSHIINTLKDRPDLHDKYIDESIQELDRIQL